MLSGKNLIDAGFKEGLKGYWIDVGSAAEGKLTMMVNLDTDFSVKKRVRAMRGYSNEVICSYSVAERGPITAWLINTMYYVFTGKNLDLKEDQDENNNS